MSLRQVMQATDVRWYFGVHTKFNFDFQVFTSNTSVESHLLSKVLRIKVPNAVAESLERRYSMREIESLVFPLVPGQVKSMTSQLILDAPT